MAPATNRGWREPTEAEMREPFAVITGRNLRRPTAERAEEPEEQKPEPDDE
jgi:hypothetical protein